MSLYPRFHGSTFLTLILSLFLSLHLSLAGGDGTFSLESINLNTVSGAFEAYFDVAEGSSEAVTPGNCERTIGDCQGTNTSSFYVIYHVFNSGKLNPLRDGWKINQDEVVVTFLKTPSDAIYFGITPYLFKTKGRQGIQQLFSRDPDMVFWDLMFLKHAKKIYDPEVIQSVFAPTSSRVGVLGSLSDTVNHLIIQDQLKTDTVFNQNIVIVTAANQSSEDRAVETLKDTLGIDEKRIFRMPIPDLKSKGVEFKFGYDETSDEFAIFNRITPFVDQSEEDFTRAAKSAQVFKLSPRQSVPPQPIPAKPLRVPGHPSGNAHFGNAPAKEDPAVFEPKLLKLQKEVEIYLSRTYGAEFKRQTALDSNSVVWWGKSGYQLLRNVRRLLGDCRDTAYCIPREEISFLWLKHIEPLFFEMPTDLDVVAIVGVDHQETGVATYSNVVLTALGNNISAAERFQSTSPEYKGSAKAFETINPEASRESDPLSAKKDFSGLFALIYAKNCAKVEKTSGIVCLEVKPMTVETTFKSRSLFAVLERLYLNPVTEIRPADGSYIQSQALVFGAPQQAKKTEARSSWLKYFSSWLW